MTTFLLYIARVGLYLTLLYAFYLLVMRRTTFFRLNRVLLMTGSYLCLILPLIRLRTVAVAITAVTSPVLVAAGQEEQFASTASFPWQAVLLGIYATGMVVTLALYGLSALKIRRLIRKGTQTKQDGCRLVVLEENIPSFSWGRTIVMNRQDLAENPAVFDHERMHVKCRHSLDLILFLPLQLLFWWNPLVWICREELRLLHEYEADAGVLKKGIDATQYQLLLVRKAVGDHHFSLASGFQHAHLKNRIAMMLSNSSSRRMRWSYLVLVPVLLAFMFACNPTKKNVARDVTNSKTEAVTEEVPVDDQEPLPMELLSKKPSFNGEENGFAIWVNSHLQYPEQAKKEKLEGRVVLQFTIGSDGAVRDVKVLKSAHEVLDAEAIRVVSASPKWEPGYNADGKAVPVTYCFPVIYKLK